MPARNEPQFSFPDRDPKNHSLPSDVVDDDALWMLLNTYADGEATEEEILRVESLLNSRPDVAREFSFLELTSHSVREFADVEPPVAMTNAIFAATARRKTFAHRLRAWWSQAGAAFGPAPLRFAGLALASGVLVIVLWPRHGVETRQQGPSIPNSGALARRGPNVIAMPPSPFIRHSDTNRMARTDVKSNSSLPKDVPIAQFPNMIVPDFHPAQETATLLTGAVSKQALPKSSDAHDTKVVRTKTDGTSVGSPVTLAKAEERHMATDTDKGSEPDALGPDVDTSPDAKVEQAVVVETTPATAPQDEPPTTIVAAVNYKPGSLSDKTRNAPPSYQSLYMRTQEAIKRQHELQQYGGYGKDAYNNIQRGEVGVSLVGGRF